MSDKAKEVASIPTTTADKIQKVVHGESVSVSGSSEIVVTYKARPQFTKNYELMSAIGTFVRAGIVAFADSDV